MSNNLKTQLLAASAMFAASSTAAFAQTAVLQYPAAELRGMGASSIAVILPREMNCMGPSAGPNKVGASDGSATNLSAEGSYTPTSGTAFNCVTQHVQPDIGGKYISTGSGAGRTAWRSLSTAAALPSTSATNQFPAAFKDGSGNIWPNPHFIFTDSAMSSTDISTYATNAATKKAGALIQVPFYVLPVAIAYNPVYGRKSGVDAKFNVANPVLGYDGTTVAGGLRLTKQVYCGIFNGYITNWNDVRIEALNVAPKAKTATSLRDPVNDTATRWSTDGAPIRLIGRLDNSGTTDIFTRHLAAACGGGIMGTGKPNLYLNNAQALPYNTSSGINLPTSGSYKTTATNGAPTFAGTTNLISGAIFTAGVLASGTEAAGKFALANLSDGVAAAIEAAPDVPSASDTAFLLNGKVGYVGADYVRPALSQTLHAAALEVGNSAQGKKPLFAMPTALNATTAFGTQILPPESDKSGKYVKGGLFSRSNPADWVEALYSGTSTLANPPVGYPITGTTQLVTGTCFADPAVRNALTAFLTASLGRLTAAATTVPDKKTLGLMFTGTAVKTLGFKAQMGIAPLPKAWSTAMYETFLVRSKMKSSDGSLLVDRNLYIQAGVPTLKVTGTIDQNTGLKRTTVLNTLTTADLATSVSRTVKGKTVFNEAAPNSTCTAAAGI